MSSDLVTPGIQVNTPMHEREIERAKMARDAHDCLGHPSDDVLKDALTNNLYTDNDLVPKDVDNANKLLGKCPACVEGKIKEPVHPSSKLFQSDTVGEVLYGDLKQTKVTCLSGYTQMLILRDYYSGYILVLGMRDKSTASVLNAVNTAMAFFASHGFKVLRLVFDHESVLKCLENKIPNVVVNFTPAGLHNRFVERAIQDLLQRKNCVEADLPYVLDKRLEVLLMENAARSSNRVPNERSGPRTTPYMLVTGKRADIPPFKFGQCLLAYIRADKNKPKRVEYVMFLYHDQKKDHICYNPITGNVLSRERVVKSDAYPKDWKVEQRPVMILDQPVNFIPDPKYSTTAIDPRTQLSSDPEEVIIPPTISAPIINGANTLFPSITHLIPKLDSINTGNISTQPYNNSLNNDSNSSKAALPIASIHSNSTPEAAPPIPPAYTTPTTANTSPVYTSPIKATNTPPLVPSTAIQPLRRSDRLRTQNKLLYDGNYRIGLAQTMSQDRGINSFVFRAYRISMKQALTDPDPVRVTSANKALYDELKQLIDMGTLLPTPINQIPPHHRSLIIPSFMFFKEKYKADGAFDKWKGRLVAGGNFVDTSLAGDISAHVVNPITVLTMLSIAASKGYDIMTADVKSAFLIPELSTEPTELTYIRIDKKIAETIIQIKPEWSRLRNNDGTFTMRLKKALYGLPVSAHKWMTHLNETLVKLDFQVTDADKCCYTRGTGDTKLILCSHVDDLLVIGKMSELNVFKDQISKEYDINIEMGYKHSYIGLDIKKNRSTGVICVGQSGYKREVINRFKDYIARERSDGKVPCGEDILTEPDEQDEQVDRTEYMSVVMSIMYLARFTRPDLSFACGMLSTHCSNPKWTHMRQAIKLLKYIATSDEYVIMYKPGPIAPEIYADASHAVHYDGKGHGCIIVKVGTGMVYIRSFKLKMITLSSTESEWIVLCEATTLAEWIKSLLLSFDIIIRPIIVRQDNTSAIWLAEHGANFARTKHLLIKKNKAKEGILNGIIHVRFTPTEFMVADLGTKPLSHRLLLLHLKNAGLVVAITENGILIRLDHIIVPAPRKQLRTEKNSNSNTTNTIKNVSSKNKSRK